MSARADYPLLARLAERDRSLPFGPLDVDRALDEIDRLTGHSQTLNQIAYQIAVALGKVEPPADYYGDVMADLAELIALKDTRWD